MSAKKATKRKDSIISTTTEGGGRVRSNRLTFVREGGGSAEKRLVRSDKQIPCSCGMAWVRGYKGMDRGIRGGGTPWGSGGGLGGCGRGRVDAAQFLFPGFKKKRGIVYV